MIVRLSDYPELRAVLKDALGNRKHKAIVEIATETTLTAPYWSEGSKDSHDFVNVMVSWAATARPVSGFPAYAWPERPTTMAVETSPTTMVVTTGIFRGKAATPQVVMHPVTAERFGIAEESRS